jgi:hypothetical protein
VQDFWHCGLRIRFPGRGFDFVEALKGVDGEITEELFLSGHARQFPTRSRP